MLSWIKTFTRRQKSNTARKAPQARLELETLTQRNLPSGVSLHGNGDLVIDGTSASDSAIVARGRYTVAVNFDGHVSYVNASKVSRVIFNGRDGNDRFDNRTAITSYVNGSNGSDTLYGGSSRDVILGGQGNDVELGQAGSDYLSGGSGNDDLRGGAGNDTLRGDDGNDHLGGGYGYDYVEGGLGSDDAADDIYDRESGIETRHHDNHPEND